MTAAQVIAHPDCAERLDVACNAAWEIESLASLLLRAADCRDALDDLAVRGVMMRMKTLAGIVMAAVDDEVDPLSDLKYRLLGDRDTEGGAA